MRSKALRARASERSCRSRTMPAIDSRIAAATMMGPYMAAAPFRGARFVGSPRNIAHAASGVNYAAAAGARGRRGRGLAGGARDQLGVGVAAGSLALLGYGLVLWAQSRGQLAVVAALRETSVLVAALIGTLVFGERFGRRRVLAAACITAGIVLLELAR